MSLFEALWEKFAPELEDEVVTFEEWQNELRATAGAAMSVIDEALGDLEDVAEGYRLLAKQAYGERDRLHRLADEADDQASAVTYAVQSLRTVSGLEESE